MKSWLKWASGYLILGLLILIGIFSIMGPPGDMPIGYSVFAILFVFFWLILGISLILIFSKKKQYWLGGLLIGILINLIFTVAFPFYRTILSKISSFSFYILTVLLALIGALIGWLIEKLKKKPNKSKSRK